jgi:hypothetical protein
MLELDLGETPNIPTHDDGEHDPSRQEDEQEHRV